MRGDPAFQKLCEDKLDKRIAVLPFENLSDPHDEYFSDGLSEELISALAQISELKVIGRSSSFRFKDRKEEPKTIGEKLGVSTLLEGTVRKQGDRVRIVAALTNAADGIELWTRTFDRELKDIFAVQEEIAKAVAESLKVRLLGSDDRSAQRAAPNSVEAHNAYLQGHFYFLRRNVDDFRKAIELLRSGNPARTLIMPWLMQSVLKHWSMLWVISPASARPRIQKREVMRRKLSRLRPRWRRRARLSAGFDVW